MSSIVSQAVTTDKSVAPEHAPKGNFAGSIELPLNRTLPRTTTTPPHNTQHSVAMAAEQQPAHKPKCKPHNFVSTPEANSPEFSPPFHCQFYGWRYCWSLRNSNLLPPRCVHFYSRHHSVLIDIARCCTYYPPSKWFQGSDQGRHANGF
jgi:hypothetical protein